MADIISRLKLESGEFDSKIKRAGQELLAYSDHCKKMGLQMGFANRDAKEFAKSLGSMGTVSNTARGKINELTEAFVNAKVMYKNMTDAEKNSEFGKNLAASLDKLKVRLDAAKKDLADVTKELNGLSDVKIDGGGLFGGGKLDGMLQVFGGNIMTKAAGFAASFASEIGSCVQQGIELARQGEGVRIAFERLGRGDLLQGLREATHGTVTDIELMKAAVQFNDFKLPLDQLGTMLAFAQQKAKDTGQSVDYLVQSIVTGLGRKSLMILDNLGLSAAEIKEKMKQTGDMTKAVGEIIREQMAKAGDYVETAADRAAQANVSLQNKMEELGRKFAPLQEASNTFWTSVKVSILDIVGGPLANFLNGLTEAGRRMSMLKNIQGGDDEGQPTRVTRQLSALRGSNFKNEKYQSQLNQYNQDIKVAEYYKKKYEEAGMAGGSVLSDVTKRFGVNVVSGEDIDNIITSLRTMRSEYIKGAKEIMQPVKVNVDTSKAISGVDDLKKRLKDLEAQRKNAVLSGDNDLVDNLTKQINETKQNIGYLDPNALKTGSTKVNKDEFTEIIGLIGMAEERVSDLQRRIKEAPDETTITTLRDQLKEAQAELDRLNGKTISVNWMQGQSGFNTDTMNAWMKERQSDLSKAELGSTEYTDIMANIADMNTIKTVLETSMRAGIDAAQFDLEPLWEKVFDGENIPDEVWQNIVDTINEKLAELELEPIKLDFKTGNIAKLAKDSKELVGDWRAAGSAISSVGSAMSQIEDPAAKVMGTIAQAIATVALAFAQSLKGSATVWDYIAGAAAGVTTMISTISAIHSATGYANGGIIQGNSYSGDNLMAMGPDGGLIGLNAGEIVLNRAQQNNLASSLNGGGQVTDNRQPYVNGELIYLGLNNYLKRTGRGEIVVSKR